MNVKGRARKNYKKQVCAALRAFEIGQRVKLPSGLIGRVAQKDYYKNSSTDKYSYYITFYDPTFPQAGNQWRLFTEEQLSCA